MKPGFEGRLPPALQRVWWLVPEKLRKAYRHIGSLEKAFQSNEIREGGLYFLDYGNGRGYSGMGDGERRLRERLRIHRLCATLMSLDANKVQVWITGSLGDLRTHERDLHYAIFKDARQVLTNTNREMEVQMELVLLGEHHGTNCGCSKCSTFEVLEFEGW